jgi:arginyl-tRNA synthetase
VLESFLKKQIAESLEELKKEFPAIAGDPLPSGFKLSPPPPGQEGDYATNLAFLLARPLKKPPLEVAQRLKRLLEGKEGIAEVRIGGGGFLNLFLDPALEVRLLGDFYRRWEDETLFQDLQVKQRIYLEFVSANPTGPLHVGHGRIAAVGDTLARIYRRLGHEVHREFYVNDRGRQMNLLGESLRVRVGELLGKPGEIPPDGYRGEYLREIARQFLDRNPVLPDDLDSYRLFAEESILAEIVRDLEAFRVRFDRYLHEEELYRNGFVSETIELLRKTPYVREENGALLFLADLFGDEKPRVLIRANEDPTYFAGDLAYHRFKFQQGYDQYINLWGADHHGYAPRLYAGVRALGLPANRLHILLIQFVTLLRGGKPVSMSTRAGEFTSLREVIEEVGVDAARYFYLRRSNDTHLEFDLDLARSQVKENPVYYVQYAHARVASLRRRAQEMGIAHKENPSIEKLTAPEERQLIRQILRYPDILLRIAETREPHELPFYLEELAKTFHSYYNTYRILDAEGKELARARFFLADLVGKVIADGLNLMGVSAPERM